MRSLLSPAGLGLLAGLTLLPGAQAQAGGPVGHGWHRGGHWIGRHHPVRAYGYAYGYGGDTAYGFAGEAIEGTYLGAPLTRFPRPSEIVPPAWGYGTYGIPTVTGISQAPTAQPTVYVIDGPARAGLRRRPARSRVLSRGSDGAWSDVAARDEPPTAGGARVVTVTASGR